MMKKAVIDSTCLIALEKLQRIDLFKSLIKEIYIPPAVKTETEILISSAIVKTPRAKTLPQTLKLGPGETEAIILALEEGNAVLLTDDRRAREMALEMGLSVMGTLGLLLRAKEKGLIPAIKPLIMQLKEAQFYLSEALIQTTLERAGEV